MTMNKNRAISLFTALVIMAGIAAPVRVFAEETVSISTITDLRDFTEKCVYDEYSKNKKFVLENDIDLSGVQIKSVEVFCGIFEGGGHSIKNVTFDLKVVLLTSILGRKKASQIT